MKSIEFTKYAMVKNEDAEFIAQGIIAFQLVKFVVDFYGQKIESVHDTKIMKDGRQFVIGGDGFIPNEYEVK